MRVNNDLTIEVLRLRILQQADRHSCDLRSTQTPGYMYLQPFPDGRECCQIVKILLDRVDRSGESYSLVMVSRGRKMSKS